ncbi:MAG TPA: hypothetical protein VJZ76_13335 [Thermoanaerobaculia bacterium]|nr:hypothetical protein [Thermoanaerobaculia bacterium]
MKFKTVARLALCALTLVFAASYTKPAHALPDHEYASYYYVGCGDPATSGWQWWPCAGGYYSSGTLSGDWLVETSLSCDPENVDSTYNVYEWCNNTWEPRSTLGDCHCSH